MKSSRIPEPILRVYRAIQRQLPDWSFITIHYLYFIATTLLASLIFWGSSTPSQNVSFTDSLFLCVSAMTEAGLNTVNLSELNTFQQFILFLLIMMGSAILVSIAVLKVRERHGKLLSFLAFKHKLEDLVKQRAKRRAERKTGRSRSLLSLSKRRSLSTSRSTGNDRNDSRGRKIPPADDDIHQAELDTRAGADVRADSNEKGGPDYGNAVLSDNRRDLPPLNTSAHGQNIDSDPENGHLQSLEHQMGGETPVDHVRFEDTIPRNQEKKSLTARLKRSRTRLFTGGGVGVRQSVGNHPREANPFVHLDKIVTAKKKAGTFRGVDRYIGSLNGFIGRNSEFHNLTEEEREKLGGLEYQAVKLLSIIVPLYYVAWQLLGAVGIGAWMNNTRPWLAEKNGLNSYWAGAFFAISAFNNSGMALLDANATVLQTAAYPLLTMSLLILAGNTCFPPFLRLILWTLEKILLKFFPKNEYWANKTATLRFILSHPRRVFTNLFPSRQTWWLVASLVFLNGTDWVFFEILGIGNKTVEAIPGNYRALDGLFQAFAVRSGGFYVVGISNLRQGLLVLYVMMMYISAYPVTMTIRTTNVYEERSLNIYSSDEAVPPHSPSSDFPSRNPQPGFFNFLRRSVTNATPTESRTYFIQQQLRGQLAHDIWLLAIAVWLISIIESGQYTRDPVTFSTFNTIFECVSGYGTVGISTGVPWNAYSFCGAWHSCSKLVLIVVMLRGRHRGLPVAIDRAVLLPSKTLAWAEEEDALFRHEKAERTERAAAMRTQKEEAGEIV